MPRAPAIDDTLTIEPPLAWRDPAQARIIWKVPIAFTPTICWKVSASSASQLAAPSKLVMAALLTSASSRFHRSIAACASCRQSASMATSPRSSKVSAPASRQAACDSLACASLRE
jgi:hypothetical protein